MYDFSVRNRLQMATNKRPIAHMQRSRPKSDCRNLAETDLNEAADAAAGGNGVLLEE